MKYQTPYWKTTPPPKGEQIIASLSEFEDGIDAIVIGYIDPDDLFTFETYQGMNTIDPANIKGWYPLPTFR